MDDMSRRMIENLFVLAVILILVVMWTSGFAPEYIAKLSGTKYVEAHFPEMEMKFVKVEWSDAFGDYLIFFEANNGETYSCVIGPSFFPFFLGQGRFEIEEYYRANHTHPVEE